MGKNAVRSADVMAEMQKAANKIKKAGMWIDEGGAQPGDRRMKVGRGYVVVRAKQRKGKR